jgi:2-hydroxy-4-carboxymuconate semialdehyde hemiacetal dehydrogenase
LFDGKENKTDVSAVDVSMNGIELQEREFFAAVRERRAGFALLSRFESVRKPIVGNTP